MRRLIFIAPAVVFVVLAALLGWALVFGNDPSKLPTALLDRPVPMFDLPPLDEETEGLATADLKPGEISVINVWASWCLPCRAEHPLLEQIAEMDGVSLYGIAYKDKTEDARAFLDDLGDPFQRIGADIEGRVGIELGVYGVPETYFVGPDGAIRYKHVGPIAPSQMDSIIRAEVEKLQK